jgi:hypothetical protein
MNERGAKRAAERVKLLLAGWTAARRRRRREKEQGRAKEE